jgi:hypothetical protein
MGRAGRVAVSANSMPEERRREMAMRWAALRDMSRIDQTRLRPAARRAPTGAAKAGGRR